ncbi:pinin-like [Schistocerca gregaria]|uniref:pinin-like n=1 Tax=Schistocerca gregaria TaxID=7010 RepID=UPI00211EFDC0|nr:pinin-like [Schistocerca gregaria]
MRGTCPRNKKVAQLPQQVNGNTAEQTGRGSYSTALTGETQRGNALAEPAAAQVAPEPQPALVETPAAPPAIVPAAASPGTAREKRQHSDDDHTMKAEPDSQVTSAKKQVTERSAPAPPTAVAAGAGPSAATPPTYSEMREESIKKNVNRLARILKESDDEKAEDERKPSKSKRRRNKRRSRSREMQTSNDERMDTSDAEASDASSANTTRRSTLSEDVTLRPDRPQNTADPPPHSA